MERGGRRTAARRRSCAGRQLTWLLRRRGWLGGGALLVAARRSPWFLATSELHARGCCKVPKGWAGRRKEGARAQWPQEEGQIGRRPGWRISSHTSRTMGCERRQQQVIQASQRHGGRRRAAACLRAKALVRNLVSTLLSQAACAVAPGLAGRPTTPANETCTIVNLHTCGRSAQQLLLVPTCRPSAWQAAMMNLLESLRM